MSGGSYNYLYCKEVNDIINNREDLVNMIDRLRELKCVKASICSQNILDDIVTLKEMINELDNKITIISDVWRAVEFYDSNDSGITHVDMEYELFCKKIR